MRYFFICLAFCFSISADDAATCKIKPAVVCDSINSELITTAEKYAEAVQNLANTIVTIPNLAIPGKIDVQEAKDIVKKIKIAAGECDNKKADVIEIIADLKKLESKIRGTDSVLQKITPTANAALIQAREDAIKHSNALLASLVHMNESAALKVKTLCKEESADDEDSDDSAEEDDSDIEADDDEESENGEDSADEESESEDDESDNQGESDDDSEDESESDSV